MKKMHAVIVSLLFLMLLSTACQSHSSPVLTEELLPVEQVTLPKQTADEFIASLPAYFLDHVNLNGKLKEEVRAEGEKPMEGVPVAADCVPDSDRTALYGTVYRFRLTAENANDSFYFRYDTIDKELAVVVPCNNFPLLLVFSAEVSGEEFAAIAREGGYLSATLLYARNMANDQLMYLGETYYVMNTSGFPSNPQAKYLVGKAAADSVEVYGTYSNDVTERFYRIMGAYYYPYK